MTEKLNSNYFPSIIGNPNNILLRTKRETMFNKKGPSF